MFESIRRLYKAGRLTAGGVQNALERGWITADQAAKILAEKQ